MNLQLEPVTRVSIVDEIVRQLRREILAGRLPVGHRLPCERELASMFKVGRTSVREALRALEAMGLVERTRSGVVIKSQGSTETNTLNPRWEVIARRASLRDLFETRIMFEVKAAQLAAERATEEDIDELEEYVYSFKSPTTPDVVEFIDTDVKFHTAVAYATQNEVLYELYAAVKSLLFTSQHLYDAYSRGRVEDVLTIIRGAIADHVHIFECIRRQDSAAAGQAMERHLTNVLQGLSRLVG
ncbi:MAG: FadR/GntR family transcriptional regulator [Bacillota bacterium]